MREMNDRRHCTPNPERSVRYVSHSIHSGNQPRGIDFEVIHDYDDHGNHRLRTFYGAGHWAGYGEAAVIVVAEIGKTYAGYTEYIGEGVNEVRPLPSVR